MAENVQRRLEESIPELRQMERTGLFTTEEVRNIVKRRKEFEYKLTKLRKPKEDFEKYIQYEMAVLSLVKIRRKKTGNHFKREEIDHSISRRIARIFKETLIRYRGDTELWLAYLDFCKSVHWKGQATRVINSMLKAHCNKPDMWITGALFEYNVNDAPDTARRLLLRGLNFNPDSKKLYLEYFMLELMFAQQKKEEKEALKQENPTEEDTVDDEIMQGKLASIIFKNAAEKIPDPEFLGSFISGCRSYSADSNEQEVIAHLKENFSGCEVTWNVLAREQLQSKNKAIIDNETKHELEQQSYAIFEDALKHLNTSKMWSYYIDFALERFALVKKKADKVMAVEHIMSLFERASELEDFKCEYYETWTKFANKLEKIEVAGKVLERGLQKYPKSEHLWIMYYKWAKKNNKGLVSEILEQSVRNVPEEESLTLWRLGIKVFSNNPVKLQKWMNEALRLKSCVAEPIKLEFLEQQVKINGLEGARSLFKKLYLLPPISRKFFSIMARTEKENESDIKELRKIYDMAVVLFGEKDIDLWLEYMDLEQNYPGGQEQKVGLLHWQAIKALSSDLTDEFISRALYERMASSNTVDNK